MNEGLAILMARIASHPEEFQDFSSNRWTQLVNIVINESRSGGFITPMQRESFTKELNKVLGDAFTQAVLRKLVRDGYDSSGNPPVSFLTEGT